MTEVARDDGSAEHPEYPWILAYGLMGYVSRFVCTRCKKELDMACLCAFDYEFFERREPWIAKHAKCKARRSKKGRKTP